MILTFFIAIFVNIIDNLQLTIMVNYIIKN